MTDSQRNQILEKLIVREPCIMFEKRGCQVDPVLLEFSANEIQTKLQKKPESICALGSSGLALGIFLSMKLELPIYFYKSEGWPETKEHNIFYLLPTVEKRRSTILVDSHFRSTNTWGECETYLKRYMLLDPLALALLFYPDTNEIRKDSCLQIITVLKASDYINEIIGSDDEVSFKKMLHPSSKFWDSPAEKKNYIERDKQYEKRLLLELQKKEEMPNIEQISIPQEIKEKAKKIPISDPGIWNYFSDPKLVSDICDSLISKCLFDNTGYLIGVSYLGSAFALCLSYSLLKQGIKARVYNSYDNSPFLLPIQDEYFPDKKDIFICQVRLITGLLALNSIKKIESRNSNRICLITIRTSFYLESERRKRPLYHLSQYGLSKIFTIIHEKK